jgi:hypothetical protein
MSVVAVNGAGKDSYIIAPLATWFMITKIRSLTVITSASYNQLKTQTYPYIVSLCEALEELLGEKLFEIVEFHIKCLKTGSEVKMFVTDDQGRAEGYHPFPDWPDAEMLVIINEAKSIKDPLWTGFARYTGYNYWLEISSSGLTQGRFYRRASKADRSHITLGRPYVRFITADECPYISKAHLESVIDDFGATSIVANSMISSTFIDGDEDETIIKQSDLDILKITNVKYVNGIYGIGLDLAAGGDETTCYVRQGNRIIDKLCFRETNTDKAIGRILHFLEPYKHHQYSFNADNGGIGNPIITRLTGEGWKITRRNNQSAAKLKKWYGNLGAEMWGHLKILIQQRAIIIPFDDSKLIMQIGSRRTGPPTPTGKVTLQSKKEARNDGRPSPDRADALCLCFYSDDPAKAKRDDDGEYKANWVTEAELVNLYARGLPSLDAPVRDNGVFTFIKGPLFNK